MATVSERARELRVALAINSFDTERARLIEQALLAERQLAMEKAAKIVDERAFALHESEDYDSASAVAKAARFVREAAEKEAI